MFKKLFKKLKEERDYRVLLRCKARLENYLDKHPDDQVIEDALGIILFALDDKERSKK